LSDQRSVQFAEGQPRETPVHDRTSLDPGTELDGPAIIEQTGSTALIPPWMAGRVEANGALVIQCTGGAGGRVGARQLGV
jgi:N-methylhydantoinase A/oxoprolinase/acetone carboxylase beta subunit